MRIKANTPIYRAMEEAFKAVGIKPSKAETVKQMMEYCHLHYPKVIPRVYEGAPGYGNGARGYLRSIGIRFEEDKLPPFINPFTKKVQSRMKKPEMLIEASTTVRAGSEESVSQAALSHLQEQAKRLHSMIKPGISKQSAVAASKALASAIDALTFQ